MQPRTRLSRRRTHPCVHSIYQLRRVKVTRAPLSVSRTTCAPASNAPGDDGSTSNTFAVNGFVKRRLRCMAGSLARQLWDVQESQIQRHRDAGRRKSVVLSGGLAALIFLCSAPVKRQYRWLSHLLRPCLLVWAVQTTWTLASRAKRKQLSVQGNASS